MVMRYPRLVFIALANLALCLLSLRAEPPVPPPTNEWDAGPISGAALDIARFRWWAPPDVKNLRGVIVLIPGRNGDGRGLVDNPEWQQFANEMQFALVGCSFYGEKDHFTYQGDPTGDVAKTINDAVEKLAAKNGHPELKRPPLVLWGHSAGACVNEVYAYRFPDRALAVINLKGPRGPGKTSPAKNTVPFLVIVGSKDKPDWVKDARANYEAGKAARAVWTLALSPTEGHEGGKSQPLALAFLRSVISQRLGPVPSGPGGTSAMPVTPKRLINSGAWLGDPETFEIAADANYKGKRKDAVWLPDESTAQAWQAFLRGQ